MKPRQPFGFSENGANSCGKIRKMGRVKSTLPLGSSFFESKQILV